MGVGQIPRHRKPEKDVRKPLGVRIPLWILEEIDSIGSRTEVTEQALLDYIKKNKKLVKKD